MMSLILCGGFGTRHNNGVNKPLTKYKGIPIVEHLVRHLLNTNNEVYILTNDLNYKNFLYLKTKYDVDIINNGVNKFEKKKGAIGDIQYFLKNREVNNLIVLASDTYFGLEDITSLTLSEEPALLAREHNNSEYLRRHGIIEVDEEGYIISFEEKPKEPRTNLVAYMAYKFNRNCVDDIRRYEDNKDDGGTLIERLIKNYKIRAIKANDVHEI